MAARKTTGKKNPSKSSNNSAWGSRRDSRAGKPRAASRKSKPPFALLFWLTFFIVLLGFFLFNRDDILSGIETLRNELSARNTAGEREPLPPLDAEETTAVSASPPEADRAEETAVQEPSSSEPAPSSRQAAPEPALERDPEPAARETAPQTAASGARTNEGAADNASARSTESAAASAARTEARPPPVEQRDRALYFTQVDRSGDILRVKTDRKLPVSASPMTDALQALIAGPSSEEQRKGLISLIPPESRILSATVRGSTAYINFSEDFRYNTYGVEGYAAQLRQIVFTATEFPNVRDVQILIEGRRVDYLGEGIWIGSPLSREML